MELGGVDVLRGRGFLAFLSQFLQARGLLREDYVQVGAGEIAEYRSEAHFWRDVIEGRQLYETCKVRLQNVVLLQWVPRAPGQYHTAEGRNARGMARHFIIEKSPGQTVFEPSGKDLMIQGGIGCLRLASKQVSRERLYFLCATTSGVAHRGLVVGVPEHLYEDIAKPLEQNGGVVCNVIGRIRYWAPGEPFPFYTPRDLRRMYVYAERITIAQTELTRELDVTAAVTFRGHVDGRRGKYFTYSRFDPKSPDSVKHCVRWMEDNYVKGRYCGKILTDFDEITPHFDDVVFPVKAMMDPQIDHHSIIHTLLQYVNEHQVNDLVRIINVQFTGNVQGLVVGDHTDVQMTFLDELDKKK